MKFSRTVRHPAPVRAFRHAVPATFAILTLLAPITAARAAPGASSLALQGVPSSHRARSQSATIVLDWYPNSDHGGLFTAIDRGIFRAHQIEMTARVPSDTSAQIPLVAAGRADFGITYEADLMAARARHIPVQSVMCIMQHPLDTVMSLQSSGISRPRDLVGKKVGSAGSPSDIPLVTAMMANDHASVRSVRFVTVGYSLLKALLLKQVDAVIGVYWTWEAIQARMKGYRVNVLRVERWGVPNDCELVLIASELTIRSRPAFVRNTVQAMQAGYAYAESHTQTAWQALHKQDSTLDRRLVIQSLQLLRPVVNDAPTIGYQNPTQWKHYAGWLESHHLVTGHIDGAAAFTNRFLLPHVRS